MYLITSFICLLFLIMHPLNAKQLDIENISSWTYRTPLAESTGLYHHCAWARIGNRLFAFNRYLNASSANTHCAYNIITDSWQTELSQHPEYGGMVMGATDGIYLYSFGSYNNDSRNIHRYDPSSDSWNQGDYPRQIPSSLCGDYWYGGVVVYIGNKKFMIFGGKTQGGAGGNGVTNLCAIWDSQNDSWSQVASLPKPIWQQATGELYHNGKVFCISGRDIDDRETTFVYVYDIETDAWNSGTELPVLRSNSAVVQGAGGMWLIGGGGDENGYGDCTNLVYYLKNWTGSWEKEKNNMPSPKGQVPFASIYGNHIYVGIGYSSSGTKSRALFEASFTETGFREETSIARYLPKTVGITAYPNPFISSISISYKIGIKDHLKYVEILVYNVLGKRIKVLENSYKREGNYSIIWDARNSISGVYTIIMKVDGKLKNAKKVLKI